MAEENTLVCRHGKNSFVGFALSWRWLGLRLHTAEILLDKLLRLMLKITG